MVDPQVRGLEVLGVALVLVGAVSGLGCGTLPGRSGSRESSFMRRVVLMINILVYLFILHRLLQSRFNRPGGMQEKKATHFYILPINLLFFHPSIYPSIDYSYAPGNG